MQATHTLSPFFVLTITILVLCSLTPAARIVGADSTVMSVTPSYVLVSAGGNFTVSVNLENSPNFIYFGVALNFNSSSLEALNANIVVPWTDNEIYIDNGGGIVTFLAYNPTPLIGNQTLATVQFLASRQGNSTLNLTGTNLIDPGHNVIPHDTENASVEVVGPISLTVASIRDHYYDGTNMIIAGNATIEGSPIDTLVGLELTSPKGTKIVRTVASGPSPPQGPWPINITEFYPSDQYGKPTSSFASGTEAYFTIQIQDMTDEALPYLIFINPYDKYNKSLGQTFAQGVVSQHSFALLISAAPVPDGTYNGSATALAEIFSDYPHNGGVPYCPEQSTNFYVTEGLTTEPAIIPYADTAFQSDFTCVFNLSSAYKLGTYSVYATTQYKTQKAAANTTLFTTVVCDFDLDGEVFAPDLNQILSVYGSTPESENWFPEADFDLDGIVMAPDLNFFLIQYGNQI
jgi:hypothetical protein